MIFPALIAATGMRAALRTAGSIRAAVASAPFKQRNTDQTPHVRPAVDQDMRHTLAKRMRQKRGIIALGWRQRTFGEIQSP